MSYQVESSEGHQSQNTDPQGQTLLLILFVDFHSGFPVQQMQLWGKCKNLGLPAWVSLSVKRIKKRRLYIMHICELDIFLQNNEYLFRKAWLQ